MTASFLLGLLIGAGVLLVTVVAIFVLLLWFSLPGPLGIVIPQDCPGVGIAVSGKVIDADTKQSMRGVTIQMKAIPFT